MNRLYDLNIPIIGITGGIAVGKTTVSTIISEEGEKVICADKLIKEIYQEPATIKFVNQIFPNAVTNEGIEFSTLRKAFFNDESLKQKIENFLYPQIKDQFQKKITPSLTKIFYDIPLLFEKKMESKFDKIILITLDKEKQIERLQKRDNIDASLAEKIINNQMDSSEKILGSDFIIRNNDDYDMLKKEVLLTIKGLC